MEAHLVMAMLIGGLGLTACLLTAMFGDGPRTRRKAEGGRMNRSGARTGTDGHGGRNG